ncbi:MAG: hypothetical protein H7232_14570 [Aeromicrobium sp.]|nr:hypothetical protein [Burkholderiales bacterium]
MKPAHLNIILAPLIAVGLVSCVVAPTASEPPAAPVPQNAPPSRVYGTMLEQGSLDAAPNVAALVDYQQKRRLQRTAESGTTLAAPSWGTVGPNNNLGRVIDIAFHPQNSNVIYIASPGGGAYKTVDGGASWTWLGGLPYQAISSIAIDPFNPNVIYFGTGHYNQSGSDLLSMGVYKTVDGGVTFNVLPPTVPTTSNTDWLRVTRVATHPTVANLVIATAASGFFLSSDGGITWSKPSAAASYDVVIDPNNPTKMLRGKYDGSVSYSINTGANWSQTAIVPPSTTTSIHTRIQYAKSAPDVVYASVNQNAGELHKSLDGGLTWALVSTPGHNETQGFHTNQLWVSPIDPNHIIVGGVDLFKSLDGGQSFAKISNWQVNASQAGSGVMPLTPHADHNAVASPPNYSEANQQFLVGTDGGLFATANARTVTESTGWTKSTGTLFISQFVGAAGRRLNGVVTLVGGLQDNGTILNTGNGWQAIRGGDGGATAIDQLEAITYGQVQNGAVHRSVGFQAARSICAGIVDASPASCGSTNTQNVNFYAPLELEPRNSSRLYFGANSLWVSANPQAAVPIWMVVKSPIPGITTSTASANYINAISIFDDDPNIVLVGHNDGQIFRSNNILAATPVWSALGGGLPTGRMVGALLIDPTDANRLYVGFTGYFTNNLWRSMNGGTTWQDISAGLPPGSIYTITRHPLAKEKVYIGTIWGSYGSENGGVTWPTVHDGPFGTQIRKLFWLGKDTLVAASFGSSLATATVPATATSAANYSDLWWVGTTENGWGMSINQHGNTQLNVLFVYDSAGNPAWYVLPGGAWNSDFTTYSGALYQPRSAPLNAYNAAQFAVGAPVGTISINFTGKSTAVVSYTINGISGQKSMQRQAFGRGTTPLTVGDMWWGGSAQDGWGISITQQAGILFGAWYTYGIDGKAIWYVMTDGTWNGLTYTGAFVSLTSSPWLGATYDPSRVAVVPAGTLSLVFSDANNALMTYAFTSGPFAGTTQTKPIVRQPY